MIDKMALSCSSIPLFNALSDLLTDLERSFYNHFIKRSVIDHSSAFFVQEQVTW